MQVLRTGERLWIDLHDRAEHDEVDLRASLGGPDDEIPVQSLVDHPEIADARMRDRRLVGRVGQPLARPAEMRGIDAAGEEKDLRVTPALGLEEAAAAREDGIGTGEEPRLELCQPRGRVQEARQLVHAVIDRDGRRQLRAEAERHRRVVPSDEITSPGNVAVEHRTDNHRRITRAKRNDRCRNRQTGRLPPKCEFWPRGRFVPWLLEVYDLMRARSPRHQVLRPLKYQVPPKM